MQSTTLKCIFLFTFSPHMFKHICRNSKPKLKRFNRFVKTPQKSCKKKHGTKNHVLSSQHSPPSTKTTLSHLTGVDLICGISGAVLRLESYFWCIGVTFSELCSILCVYNSQKHHCLHYTAISIVSHYLWCDRLCSVSGFVSHYITAVSTYSFLLFIQAKTPQPSPCELHVIQKDRP